MTKPSIRIHSKTLDPVILRDLVDHLVSIGLNPTVKLNVRGELLKRDHFRISIMPVNGCYGRGAYEFNEDYDRILIKNTEIDILSTIFPNDSSEIILARQDKVRELVLKSRPIIKYTRDMGFTQAYVSVSDAYIWIEFSKPDPGPPAKMIASMKRDKLAPEEIAERIAERQARIDEIEREADSAILL